MDEPRQPGPEQPGQIEVGASVTDGDLRYWRSKEAVRQGELRLSEQAAIRTALEARASAITGWASASWGSGSSGTKSSIQLGEHDVRVGQLDGRRRERAKRTGVNCVTVPLDEMHEHELAARSLEPSGSFNGCRAEAAFDRYLRFWPGRRRAGISGRAARGAFRGGPAGAGHGRSRRCLALCR